MCKDFAARHFRFPRDILCLCARIFIIYTEILTYNYGRVDIGSIVDRKCISKTVKVK